MTTSIILLNAFPDKKIKSLGNKYLLKINNQYLIDYKIQLLKKLYHNPEIILVGGFDSKKLQKHINKNYENIKYVSHNFDTKYNIGKSIIHGIAESTGESCLLLNSSVVLSSEIKNKINNDSSWVFVYKTNQRSSNIGCITNNNLIINCYYGLNNELYDILYINNTDMIKFKKLINSNNIEKLFLFEIINLCIENKINIRSNFVNKKAIHTIDSGLQIKNLNNV